MKKSLLIILVSLVILIGLFMAIKSKDTIKPPITPDRDNYSSENFTVPGDTNVKRFSDTRKVTPGPNDTGEPGSTRPTPTPKPLPYPRISLNYSIQTVSSIRDNDAGENSTFILVLLDIRNYGYEYFDAYPNNFRGTLRKKEEIIPLVNISTGNTIEAVIPNNSRAKGDLLFLIDKKQSMTKIIYSPVNKSENYYYIMYNQLSPYQMEERKEEIDDEEDV